MANDLAKAEPNQEIRYSISALLTTIPNWVDHKMLGLVMSYGYPLPTPPNAGPALRDAAEVHRRALSPASSEKRHAVLMGLRSATIIRDETRQEAEATLSMLRVHLEDVPLDILESACCAYCNAPGRRFFPKSAGELRAFTNPLMFERKARAVHLDRLAKLADEADKARAREAELLTPEQFSAGYKKIEAIMAGAAMRAGKLGGKGSERPKDD